MIQVRKMIKHGTCKFKNMAFDDANASLEEVKTSEGKFWGQGSSRRMYIHCKKLGVDRGSKGYIRNILQSWY